MEVYLWDEKETGYKIEFEKTEEDNEGNSKLIYAVLYKTIDGKGDFKSHAEAINYFKNKYNLKED